MIRALWTAATGMEAQQMAVDVLSNNLANVNTSGFKKSRLEFQDLLYDSMRAAGTESSAGVQLPTGMAVGNGCKPVATAKIFTQGDFLSTGNSLDLVIQGDGFFQVLKTDGDTGYCRDGAFKVDSDGKVVNSEGLVLQPEITIPSDTLEITVGSDGTVSVIQAGNSTPQTVGTIEIARFVNPAGLKSLGKNLYEVTDASGDATTGTPGSDGLGELLQGYLEMSNVKVVEEMVNMIVCQRAYEVNAKAIQAADDMLMMANRIRR